MKQTVNERVKLLRTAAGKTQIEFAADLDVSISIIAKIETGDQPASTKLLDKIIDVYSVPEKWLIKGEGEMTFKKPEKNANDSPWKDEAYQNIKEAYQDIKKERDNYWNMLQKFMSGEVSFLTLVKDAG